MASRPATCDALTQDGLRKRLYRTFKERGVLDALKTQLRNLLVRELTRPLPGGGRARAGPAEGRLLLDAADSLVAGHLRRRGCEYALSVFLPESGLAPDKVLSERDVLQLVGIRPPSGLHASLVSAADRDAGAGFLVRLLRELADRHEAKQSRDAEAQTDAAAPGSDSLAEKLRLIDDAFADAKSRHPKTASLDAKLRDYKRDLEEQLRAEMRQRLEYLRETEIARVKMEERRRREEALAELRGACARAWRAKAESLAAREKEAVERVRRLQEIEARDVYTERQRLLRDMDALRAREAELTRRADAFELSRKQHEEETRRMTDALRRREQQLQERVRQLELQDEQVAGAHKPLEHETESEGRAVRLQEALAAISARQTELGPPPPRVREREVELESLRAQLLAVTEQNRVLSERVKDTCDDSAKIKDTTGDSAKIKDTRDDSAKIKDTSDDSAKIRDTGDDSAKIRDTSNDLARMKDRRDDSARIKDTSADSAKIKDMSDDSAKIKDTRDDSAKIKDTSDDSAKIKDTRDDSAEIKDTSDDSAKIKDTRDDSARMKDTSDDSAKSKDTSDDSARIKDTSGDSAKIKDTRDDSALKAERLALQAQNELLRRQLADSRSENVRLLSRLAQPAAELAVLQDELREAGRAIAAEHERFEAHKQALRKQLQDEASTRDP